MKKLVFVLLLLWAASLAAQAPATDPLALTEQRVFADFGRLQLQYNTLFDYVKSLQARNAALETENKELTAKNKELTAKVPTSKQ